MYRFVIIILLMAAPTAYAQQNNAPKNTISGIVIYHQRIALKNLAVTSDTLKFNRTESIFHWYLHNPENDLADRIKQRYPMAEVPENISSSFYSGVVNYFNMATDSLFSRKPMGSLNAVIYLKEEIPEINWNITDGTKEIGNYNVQKATGQFRGRHYTAWFTRKIPLPYGPWKLHGLPGLILQAYDESGNIYFSATKIEFKNIGSIEPISLTGGEKVVSLSEYKNIMKNFKKHIKRATVKQVSNVANKIGLSNKDLAEMEFNYPGIEDIKVMETFDEDKK